MRKQRVLWAIVFGSILAITGCGGSSDDDGSGNTNGSGNSNGNGGADSTCEAFCGSTCIIEDIDPGDDFAACVQGCSSIPNYDKCGSQAKAWVDCLEAAGCPDTGDACQSQGMAWGVCIAGIALPL